MLQEVAQFQGVKIDWNELVKKTSTGITNAREYQTLWRHLAYRGALPETLEDGDEPLVSFGLLSFSRSAIAQLGEGVHLPFHIWMN